MSEIGTAEMIADHQHPGYGKVKSAYFLDCQELSRLEAEFRMAVSAAKLDAHLRRGFSSTPLEPITTSDGRTLVKLRDEVQRRYLWLLQHGVSAIELRVLREDAER